MWGSLDLMDAQQAHDLEKSYDEVPYESLPYPETHPANTAMVARLFGLTPPDFRNARVLELGCSGGGNLAPLALTYPSSRFIGIDFSQEAINEANALKNFARLKNVEFLRQDILAFDIAKHRESFDYIISHGVFSWVPHAVSAKILEICGACLKQDGLAVISYNALPGWNAVRSIRDMLMHHAAGFKTPQEKILRCREFLDFLAENAATTGGYRTSVLEERNLLKDLGDFYVFHDHMSGENSPFYFRDFMRMAQQQQLAYVGEAILPNMFFDNQAPEVVKMLRTFDDIVEQEQYLDYVRNRRFRSTILCKSARKLNRNISGRQILDFYLTANMAPKDNTDPAQARHFRERRIAICFRQSLRQCPVPRTDRLRPETRDGRGAFRPHAKTAEPARPAAPARCACEGCPQPGDARLHHAACRQPVLRSPARREARRVSHRPLPGKEERRETGHQSPRQGHRHGAGRERLFAAFRRQPIRAAGRRRVRGYAPPRDGPRQEWQTHIGREEHPGRDEEGHG